MQWENLTAPDFARAVKETGTCIMAFGVVERHVGCAHQRLRVAAVYRRGRHADAALELNVPDRQIDAGRIDGVVQRVGNFGRVVQTGVHEHQGKFVTGETRDVVVSSRACTQQAGNGAQRLVAGRMAVGVIDELEAIHVDDQQAHRLALRQQVGEDHFELDVECRRLYRPVAGRSRLVVRSSVRMSGG
jgi:hypothetical protein